MTGVSAQEIIETLGMARHPEGGWYVQTFADQLDEAGRSASTAIYYLLQAGEASHWHRIDAVEVWHFYAGAPLKLRLSDSTKTEEHIVGPALAKGQRPQVIVPRKAWQSAASTGDWTLVGCTVAPGFQFSGFELADAGWEPA